MTNVIHDLQKKESRDPRIEILRIMDERYWKREDLAEVMEVSGATVSLILSGKQMINMGIAVKLANALGRTPEYWIVQEMRHLGISEDAGNRVRAELYSALPIREIRARGWIDDSTETERMAAQICHIYGYERDPDKYPSAAGFLLEKMKQNHIRVNLNSLWVAKAKQYLEHKNGRPISLQTYKGAESELESIGCDDVGVQKIMALLERAGIGFCVLPRLNRMQLLGAIFMIDGAPIIVYGIDGGTSLQFCQFIKLVIAAASRLPGETFYLEPGADKRIDLPGRRMIVPDYFLTNSEGQVTCIEVKATRGAHVCKDQVKFLERLVRMPVQLVTLPTGWPERSVTMAGAPIKKRIVPEKHYLENVKKTGHK